MLIALPLLDADEVRRARALLADAPWGDGGVSAGDQALQVKNNEQLPPGCDASRALLVLIRRALDRSPRFLAAALPRKVFPPRFNRYTGATNSYGSHVDGAIRFTDNGVRVRTDLSCTVFLSEPHEYEGGELVAHGAGREQRVKLPAGHAVLYPGTTVHEVTPVTRGARIASFFWIESMVRSTEQRQLLFEMDMALLQLRARGGEDDPALVRLTGTYHNLLRMWADT
jgi:PKHD-type hydroxylase